MGTRFVPQFATLALSVAAARYLGPDGLGRQSFIAFVSLSLAALVSDGISSSLGRHVGEAVGRGDDGTLVYLARRAWRMQAMAAALAAGVLLVIAASGATPRAAWAVAAVVCAAAVLHSIPAAVLAGMQRWREMSIVGVVTSVLVVPTTIAVLALGGGITGMFVVEAVFAVAGLAFTARLARQATGGLIHSTVPRPDAMRSMLTYAGYATAFSVVTLIVWRRSELVFLDHFASDREVAFYSISFAAVTALAVIPQALAAVMLPAFATLHGAQAQARIGEGAARSVRLLSAASLPLTAAAIALGPAAIELVYGRDYTATSAVLRLMLSAFPLMALYLLCTSLLYALGELRVLLAVSLVAAAANVALALVLIPGNGAVAAAAANVGGQVCAALPLVFHAWRVTGRRRWWSPSLGSMAAASAVGGGAAAAVLGASGAPGLPLAAAAAVAGFAAVAMFAPLLEGDDARWLEDALGPRAGRALAPVLRRLAGGR